eukprot:m.2199 g.2199  ORF g.2199 m.2199 type:complete len:908 (+) comp8435_c0_seq1:143-2866(+)
MTDGNPGRGLSTSVDQFPQGLLDDLGLYLDKEDELAGRDWRVLVKVLNLDDEDVEIVRKKECKTETALKLWSLVDPDANGRLLVAALREMRHNKAARIVEYHLGDRYDTRSGPVLEQMEELDRLARFGDVKMLSESLELFKQERKSKSVEEMFANWLYTPLHSAARYGHLPAVVLLVESGFNVQRENSSGETASVIAERNSQQHVADYLEGTEKEVRACDVPSLAKIKPRRSPIDRLVADSELTELEKVLKTGVNPNEKGLDDWNPLHTAAAKGDLRAVEILVNYNADITARDGEGFTPEDWAKRNRLHEVAAFLKKKRIELEKEDAADQDLINMTITITSQNPEDDPVEFPIVSLNLEETLKEISITLSTEITQLVSQADPAVIIKKMDQLKDIREVIAMTSTDKRPETSPTHRPLNVTEESVAGARQPDVLVHHIDYYWDPPVLFRFKPYEDWSVILSQVSKALGKEIVNLYTWDKLSKITTGRILAQKARVVAVTKGTNMPAKRQMLPPRYIGSTTEKEVTEAGAFIFARDHAIAVEIPVQAVTAGDKVTVTVRASLPGLLFDMGPDEWKSLLPAGHPVQIETSPPGYEFQKPVRVRIAHCGDVEENRDGPSVVVLTSLIQRGPGAVQTFQRLSQEMIESVSLGYVWMNARRLSAWFWPFVKSDVACRLCTIAVYSHSDRQILETNESEFKMLLIPGINFYRVEFEAFMKKNNDESAHRGAMNIAIPYGREVDVGVTHQHDNWMINPERQIVSFSSIWGCLFKYSENNCPFSAISFQLRYAGSAQEKKSSPLSLNFEVNRADGRNEFFLESCVNFSDHCMASSMPLQCKEEISQVVEACLDAERGTLGLARNLGIKLPPKTLGSAKCVLEAFDKRKGARHELRLALTHLDQGEAVAILDKVHVE